MKNEMTEKEYTILHFDRDSYYTEGVNIAEDEIMVGSSYSSYSKNWPKIILKDNIKYSFSGLTAMPESTVGNYFSTAIYKKSSYP